MRLQKRNLFAWLRSQKRAMQISLAAVALVAMVSGPFTQVARADFASLTINNNVSGSFTVGQQWLLKVGSNLPSTSFDLCATFPNGDQGCSLASAFPGSGSTDASGTWSLFGSFPINDPTIIGAWTEWVKFPSGQESNHIAFTVLAAAVPPSATLTLVSGVSGGTYTAGDGWMLGISSNVLSSPFDLCAIHPNGVQDCTPNGILFSGNGSTDANGNWSGTGTFPRNDPTILGTWTEWAKFPSGFTSSRITFTVVAPTASFTINGATSGNFTLGQAWTLDVSSNLRNQNILLCGIHPNGVQACVTQSKGVNLSPTDGNGHWSLAGSFDPADPTIPGTWTEWLQFPGADNFASNRITFTVAPPASAGLTINGSTSGNYLVGQPWTLHVTSTLPSTTFDLCAIHPNGAQDCTPTGILFPGNGSTDGNGNWTGIGAFSATSTGAWTEWAKFPSGLTSSRIVFTVSAPSATGTATSTVVSLSPQTLNFTMQQGNIGSIAPQNNFVTFSVAPDQLISWTSVSSATWLVSQSGVARTSGTVQVAVNPSAASLAPGIYPGSLVFSPSAGATTTFAPQTVLVNLTVQATTTCQVNCGGGGGGNPATISISPSTLPNGTTTVPYSATLAAIGTATGPFTWTVSVGTLPAGLVFGTSTVANASISGTPTATGTYPFTVAVANQTVSAAQAYVVTIGALPASNPTSTPTSTPAVANLAITKSVDNAAPQTGATVNYTVTVTALGPAASTGVVATDTLPSGVLFENATASIGSYASSTGTWTIGTMSASSTATLKIAAAIIAAAGQTVTNMATVGESASSTNQNISGSTASSTITVATSGGGGGSTNADIAVVKTVDTAFPKGGDVVHYLVTVTALGPSPSTFVVAHDLLPTGLSLVQATASQGTYSLGTGDWTIGTVNANATATLALSTMITPNAAGQTIVNNVTVSELGSLVDTNIANNSSSVSIFIQSTSTPTANLSVSKSVDVTAPAPNATVNYTVTVHALGPATSTGVVANDPLPSGLGFLSATASTGGYASSTGVWAIGDMSAGSTATLQIAATVNVSAGSVIVNNATVGESASSTNVTGGSTASSTITVTTPGGGGGNTTTTTTNGGGGGNVGVGAGSGGTGGGLYYAFDIKINGGAPTTDSSNVTLTLSATGASQMWIANDPSLFSTSTPTSSDSTGWIPFAGTYPWTLTAGSGNKTVYARFGNHGVINGSAQAAIHLMDGSGQVLGASTSSGSDGQVLGASLSCGLYLNDYIHPVRKGLNNPNEVKKLQTFLDAYMGLSIPITGDYDAATIAGVNQFQIQNNKSVLAPWVPYGLANDTTPTGYVYKTTRRWINLIVCPPLGLPMPQLP